MSDMISRQDAIDYIKTQRGRPFIGITLEEAIIMMIEEVPSAGGCKCPCEYREPCDYCPYRRRGCPAEEGLKDERNNCEVSLRCKDCKHWIPYDWMFSEVWQSKNMEDYPEDEMGCDCCDMNMGANDYCSRAERRGDSK